MALSAVVVLLVFALLAWNLIRYRASEPGEPSATEGNARLEIIWTAAPALLLVVLFVIAVQTMRSVEAGSVTPGLRVQVIGHQWWWEYRYPDLGVVTANELHL